jgi:hypothetical protein
VSSEVIAWRKSIVAGSPIDVEILDASLALVLLDGEEIIPKPPRPVSLAQVDRNYRYTLQPRLS